MKTLVFEIGTEEMPAAAARSAAEQLRVEALKLLVDFRLTDADTEPVIEVYATPRRLVLFVPGLAEAQRAAVEDVKGPPKRIAFSADGSPTAAAMGFAKTQGVDVGDLEVREADGGEYIFAVKKLPGRPAGEVLPEMLAALVGSIEFNKTMRWGSGSLRFIRPIRWLLALYGDQVVPFELDGLSSGRLTYGHRFLAEGPYEPASADEYKKIMETAKVVLADEAQKAGAVKSMIETAADAAGGRAAINPKVLDEVVCLVEDPHAVVGSYDKDFLKIPRSALVTAMESHQRYFPIEDGDGKLLPLFAVVHNGDTKYDAQIAHGHERVLRARLADAAFFFNEDIKTTLESKVERLKGVVWQRKLGTVLEKVERVRGLGARIAGILALNEDQKAKIDRAAFLAKADLTTAMVIEFTDLQGEIGREYAFVDGEDRQVAEAVAEHWRPRFAGDGLPQTTTGQVVAVADKIDTIVGCWLVGLIPSGSADPYSLRRQAAGIIGILGATQWRIGILELIELAIGCYAEAGVTSADPTTAAKQLQDFIFARLKKSLVDAGALPETIEAVVAAGFDVVGDIADRVALIDDFAGTDDIEDIKLAFTRCQNLAKGVSGDEVDPDLFEDEEERRLFDAGLRAKAEMDKIVADGCLATSLSILASLRGPIDSFFDAVMVMAPDENVRANRLRLLNLCLSISRRIADFSKLSRDMPG